MIVVVCHDTVIVTIITVSFLEAGSDVIGTATYQASVDGICKHLSCSSSDALDVIRKAATIARDARDEFWQNHVKHGAEGTFLHNNNKSLFSEVSSPLDHSKHCTSSHSRPFHSDINFIHVRGIHSRTAITARRLFTHIRPNVYSQVLICTAE